MQVKLFEIRDRATFIPVFAISTRPANDAQHYLLRRDGWTDTGVIVGKLSDGSGQADPWGWGCRRMTVAHDWIEQNFDKLEDGAVIDIEFILGETAEPKRSERETVFVEQEP